MGLEGLFSEDDKALKGYTLQEGEKKEIVDISLIPPLECVEKEYIDIQPIAPLEKVKEGQGLKILTPHKLLTRLPILLDQIIRIILYLLHEQNKTTKTLQQLTEVIITK